MIERSPDLTFVWGFFRSFCSNLRERIKGSNCNDVFSDDSNLGNQDNMFQLQIYVLLMLFCRLVNYLWNTVCWRNLSVCLPEPKTQCYRKSWPKSSSACWSPKIYGQSQTDSSPRTTALLFSFLRRNYICTFNHIS